MNVRFSIPAHMRMREMSAVRSGGREMGNLFLPEFCQVLIRSLKFISSDNRPAHLSFRIINHHPVTLEFAADGRPIRINRTGKSIAVTVFLKKNTFFMVVITPLFPLFIFFCYIISVFRYRVGQKKLTGDAKPAVVITAAELALNPDKFAKTTAASSAPVAFKLHHMNRSPVGEVLTIKHKVFFQRDISIAEKESRLSVKKTSGKTFPQVPV
jgi:hypothetical protein